MTGVFRKAILKVGTYHSPDGVVEVTPERLRHWENETRKLQHAGYAIPMHWNHASEKELLEPVSLDLLQSKQGRGAEATVGKLNSFRVSPDGQTAEITVHTLTPSATEKVAANAVYVSPVIFPQWKDGAGNSYSDVITSVDLVDHPVDYTQTSFQPAEPICCAIRLGLSTTPYRMGAAMADDKENDAGDSTEGAMNATSIKDVLSALADLKIVLPDDTTEANFLDRLRTALLTAKAQSGMDTQASDGDDQSTVSDPMIATMSLQARQALAWAEGQHQAAVSQRLKALLDTGRCTPDEHRARSPQLTAIKLSLGSDNKPVPGQLENWIESRKAVPQGTFWSSDEKLKRMSVQCPDPPSQWNTTGTVSEQEHSAAVGMLTKHLKAK